MTSPINKVLFVCTQNAIRSPIAELIAGKNAPDNIQFESAGLMSGYVDPFLPAVLMESGIDCDSHVSKALDDVDIESFDVIITLTQVAHQTVVEAVKDKGIIVEYWPTQNPSKTDGNREQILDMYRKVRDMLAEQIKNRFQIG